MKTLFSMNMELFYLISVKSFSSAVFHIKYINASKVSWFRNILTANEKEIISSKLKEKWISLKIKPQKHVVIAIVYKTVLIWNRILLNNLALEVSKIKIHNIEVNLGGSFWICHEVVWENGDIIWPSRSADSIPLDYFFV